MILKIEFKKEKGEAIRLSDIFIEVKDPVEVYEQLKKEWVMFYPMEMDWDLYIPYPEHLYPNKGSVLIIRPEQIKAIHTYEN